MNISKGGHLFGLATFFEPSLQQILQNSPPRSVLLDLTLRSLSTARPWPGKLPYFLKLAAPAFGNNVEIRGGV